MRQLATALTLACLAQASASAAPVAVAPIPGYAVPIGGALRYDNDEVWQRLVALAGGPGAQFVILPTASANPDGVAERTAATLQRHGARAVVLPIAPWWPGLGGAAAREAAAHGAHAEVIRHANAVFITGGAQGRLIDTLIDEGVESPVLAALRALQARGGLIAGTSAGAAVMSRTMFRDAPSSLAAMKGVLRLGKEVDQGFGFVGSQILVDQHALKRGRFGRMLALMLDQKYPLGLGVDEDTAAVVHGHVIEVIGHRGALMIDLRQAVNESAGGLVKVRNVRLSYLDPGDTYDLMSGRATASVSKRQEKEQRFRPKPEDARRPPPVLFADMFGDNMIVSAMGRLAFGPFSAIAGIAFDPDPPDNDPFPGVGFEFVLRRDERTRAWFAKNSGVEEISVFEVRLDVKPIRMAKSLYQPVR